MDEPTKDAAKITLSRRKAMAALGVGAVAVAGTTLAVAYESALWARGQAEQTARALNQNAELQKQNSALEQQVAQLQLELLKYKGLVALYETLDKIAIDSVIGAALGAYKTTLNGLEAGIESLRAGLIRAENALDSFESAFASIRHALESAEAAVANVAALLKHAQDLIAQTTSPLLPFVDQARRFFDDLLGRIPFGVGDEIRKTINGIIGLLVAIPSMMASVNDDLLKRLREDWFSDDQARNLEATLAKPIVENVLQPVRRFLDEVERTLNAWEEQVVAPVNRALSQRAIIQQQIRDYRREHKI